MNYVFLACAFFSLFFLGFMDMARGPIYPELLEHFSLGPSAGSYFFTVASFSALLANLTCRWWMRWWSSIKSLTIFTVLQVIGGIGISWAAYWPNGFAWILFFSFVFGLALGGLGIAINVLTVESSSPEKQKKVLSGVHTMYGLAALLAPLVVSGIIDQFQDWRLCFFVFSSGPLLLAIYCLFFVDQTKSRPTVTDGQPRLSKQAWYFAVAIAFYVGAEMVISTRLVFYLRSEMGFSSGLASTYLSLFFVGLMAGRLFNVFVKVPWSEWWGLMGATVLSTSLFAVGLFVHPLGLVFCGLTMASIFPDFVASAARIRRSESDRIVAIGVTGVAVVLVVMHWGVGLLAEIIGLRSALTVGIGFLLVVFSLLFFLKSDFVPLENS